MIEARGLNKRFGEVIAVHDVSFAARDGAITGLVGPNGAGKSTTLRMLYTVLRPDAGTAAIDQVDVVREPLAARARLGVLPHASGLYPNLTARENIRYFGALHGLERAPLEARVAELLRLLELESIADRRARGFSQGERIKVAIARALVHAPRNLIRDGDPHAARRASAPARPGHLHSFLEPRDAGGDGALRRRDRDWPRPRACRG